MNKNETPIGELRQGERYSEYAIRMLDRKGTTMSVECWQSHMDKLFPKREKAPKSTKKKKK